jgi:hypothetical protein
LAAVFFGAAAVAVAVRVAAAVVDFTALDTFTVALTAGLEAAALDVPARAVDFTADAVLVLFAGTAGVFAGFFIAFAIESTAN